MYQPDAYENAYAAEVIAACEAAAPSEAPAPFSTAPDTLNGKPFNSHWYLDDKGERKCWGGPVYPRLPELDKFRRIAASGHETEEESRAYGRAVGEAFRKLNRISASKPISMASTAETDARCRARIKAEFERGVAADRARRTDEQIIAAYHATMAEKRKAEQAAERRATLKAQMEASIELLEAQAAPEARQPEPVRAAPVTTPQPAKAATRARKPIAAPKPYSPFQPRPQAVPPGILAAIARRADPAFKSTRLG